METKKKKRMSDDNEARGKAEAYRASELPRMYRVWVLHEKYISSSIDIFGSGSGLRSERPKFQAHLMNSAIPCHA